MSDCEHPCCDRSDPHEHFLPAGDCPDCQRHRLHHVVAELARGGWPVDPVPDDAPDSVVIARLLTEERRLRVMGEAS